jgi:hypothetical protein
MLDNTISFFMAKKGELGNRLDQKVYLQEFAKTMRDVDIAKGLIDPNEPESDHDSKQSPIPIQKKHQSQVGGSQF